jgi:ligand-binding sensor domain-containing protein
VGIFVENVGTAG